MNYLKTIKRIENHKVTIDIPEDFKSEEVEVIVLPHDSDAYCTENLMKISEESFKEWDNESDEVYNNI